MIKQETARDIFNCYSEINKSGEMLKDIEKIEEKIKNDDFGAFRKEDLEEEYFPRYELGVPSSPTSKRLFYIKPQMAKAVIESHLSYQKARLVELNQIAKIEIETEETCY